MPLGTPIGSPRRGVDVDDSVVVDGKTPKAKITENGCLSLPCLMTSLSMTSLSGFNAPPIPALISSTSKQEQNAEIQYTEGETNQLFGGPLQLLYKARRWKPFRDPNDVFADVFGSKIPLGAIPRLSVTGR
jgi:hypothetical protein